MLPQFSFIYLFNFLCFKQKKRSKENKNTNGQDPFDDDDDDDEEKMTEIAKKFEAKYVWIFLLIYFFDYYYG